MSLLKAIWLALLQTELWRIGCILLLQGYIVNHNFWIVVPRIKALDIFEPKGSPHVRIRSIGHPCDYAFLQME